VHPFLFIRTKLSDLIDRVERSIERDDRKKAAQYNDRRQS
jgi:hypothetical protein